MPARPRDSSSPNSFDPYLVRCVDSEPSDTEDGGTSFLLTAPPKAEAFPLNWKPSLLPGPSLMVSHLRCLWDI